MKKYVPESGMEVRSRDELDCIVQRTSDHQCTRSQGDRVSLYYKKGEWTDLKTTRNTNFYTHLQRYIEKCKKSLFS